MAKIIDVFMFYQEVELLKIRLEYLDPYVDKFIILESCQLHSGKSKNFHFEKYKSEIKKYLKKIHYYKIEDSFSNYNEIIKNLETKQDQQSKIILKNFIDIYENKKIINKKNTAFLLDTYQRESLHYAMKKANIADEDIILISDIDEIPNWQQIKKILKTNILGIYCLNHLNFSYYLNLLSNEVWAGTLISKYKFLKMESFNILRMDAKKSKLLIKMLDTPTSGYHFNSFGGIDSVKSKIKAFGHQEFNNRIVLNNLEYNISRGKDIFGINNSNFQIVLLNNSKFFDHQIQKILNRYNDYTLAEIKKSNLFKDIIYFILVNFMRLIYKIKTNF